MLNYSYDLDRLLERLRSAGGLEQFLSDLFAFETACSASPQVGDVLSDPKVTAESKLEWIEGVFGGMFGEPFYRFLLQLARNDDIGEMDLIADRILSAVRRLGVETAEVISVVPLSAGQLRRVRDALRRITGSEVYAYNRLSADILGGFTIRYEGRTLDMSLRRDLEALRDEIVVGGEG
jgi:ATP synthase F1 delta subunit